jgi:hypothetical protein
MRMPSWMTKSAACVLVALLSACKPPDQFPPACPQLRLLADAADLTSFNGRGQDVTDQLLTARIASVPASCESGGRGKVDATIKVVMVVDRGPALPGRTAAVPYFLTVMDGERVMQQKDYAMPVEFPPNVDEGKATSDDIAMEFPVTPQKSAAAYTIYVGFRLTPEQLQYNRRNAPR